MAKPADEVTKYRCADHSNGRASFLLHPPAVTGLSDYCSVPMEIEPCIAFPRSKSFATLPRRRHRSTSMTHTVASPPSWHLPCICACCMGGQPNPASASSNPAPQKAWGAKSAPVLPGPGDFMTNLVVAAQKFQGQ